MKFGGLRTPEAWGKQGSYALVPKNTGALAWSINVNGTDADGTVYKARYCIH